MLSVELDCYATDMAEAIFNYPMARSLEYISDIAAIRDHLGKVLEVFQNLTCTEPQEIVEQLKICVAATNDLRGIRWGIDHGVDPTNLPNVNLLTIEQAQSFMQLPEKYTPKELGDAYVGLTYVIGAIIGYYTAMPRLLPKLRPLLQVEFPGIKLPASPRVFQFTKKGVFRKQPI